MEKMPQISKKGVREEKMLNIDECPDCGAPLDIKEGMIFCRMCEFKIGSAS